VIGFSRAAQKLVCDGVPLSAIAEAEGTPVYVYSAAVLRERYRAIDSAFGSHPHRLHYALKANSTLGLARTLRELGSAADANSIWEIELARKAGFPAADIVFTGVGKSPAELECAVPLGLKAINVESVGELARVEAIAARLGLVARVALRVNPDIDAKSHPHISTGLKINKFGIPLDDVRALFATIGSRRSLTLVALHVHIGSQVTTTEPLARSAALVAELVAELRGVHHVDNVHDVNSRGVALEYVDLGGGLGISYDGRAVPTVEEYATALLNAVAPTGLPIVIEPGRAIVGPSGTLVARVIDLKPRNADSQFAVLDAGMAELMRPALYNAYHRVEPVSLRSGSETQYELVGPICESADVVARDRMLTPLEVGDLVAIRDAGAYGSAMASNYNRHPLPAEVLVDNGQWRVIRRRQTIDDMTACET
jgi:diaminopimelate decarboxylase